MKFLFVENRYKTYFWEALAKYLVRNGHEISWLVQNHAFMPRVGKVNVLPYPGRADLRAPEESPDIAFIRSSDRSINFLGGDDRHYAHYQQLIHACLDREQPDAVIGESSLFHELMAAAWCRSRGVKYLFPSMPGYPNGRFCIYDGYTKTPLGQCEDIPSVSECLAAAQAIRGRATIPDYMRPPTASQVPRVHPVHRSWQDHRNILFGYLAGERYNTTSPWRRLWRPFGFRARTWKWERLVVARQHYRRGCRYVLYPMQMQPEANLDVWGNRHRDQTALIAGIADVLPEDCILFVKANPKTKYEMSRSLIEAIRSRDNVVPLPIALPMGDILPEASLVMTVTGTVAVECVLSGVPLAQLGPGITEGIQGCETIAAPAELPDLLGRIGAGQYPAADEANHVALIQRLFRTSFPGLVSDPATLPDVLQNANVVRVAAVLFKAACA
ncbi:MAG: hypothetical protein ACRESZ_15025 [Methylococcales bacterium]